MQTARWLVLGTCVVLLGAAAGFAAALLRPRRYADFVGSHEDVTPLSTR